MRRASQAATEKIVLKVALIIRGFPRKLVGYIRVPQFDARNKLHIQQSPLLVSTSQINETGVTMAAASDLVQIAPSLFIWQVYDPAVKSDLFCSAILTAEGILLIDPIAMEDTPFSELRREGQIAGIVVTNFNHHRAFAKFAEQFSVPIFARRETFPDKTPRQFNELVDGDKICDELQVIGIESAGPGEIALHYAPSGGTLIVGDALINFEPYGFTFLPAKYCSNEKEMRRSLRKLLRYKADRMLFAHGLPILSGASDRLQRLLDGDL